MGYKPGQSFADYLAEQQAAFQPVRIPGAEGGFDTQFDPRAAYTDWYKAQEQAAMGSLPQGWSGGLIGTDTDPGAAAYGRAPVQTDLYLPGTGPGDPANPPAGDPRNMAYRSIGNGRYETQQYGPDGLTGERNVVKWGAPDDDKMFGNLIKAGIIGVGAMGVAGAMGGAGAAGGGGAAAGGAGGTAAGGGGGLLGTVGSGDALAALNAYSAANPVTMAQMMVGVPDIASITAAAGAAGGAAGAGLAAGGGGSTAGAYGGAAADSQAANAMMASGQIASPTLTGAASIPASVNLGSLGGSMATGATAAGGASDWMTALGGAKTLVPLAGSLLGAAAGAKGTTETQTKTLDPRMDAYLYGSGGLLSGAQDWFNKNKGGNALVDQGVEMQRKFLTDPAYAQGYDRLRTQGLGLLGGGITANPFSTGQATLTRPNISVPGLPSYFNRG